ncbi:reverse transcriptase domain-containing protein [Tanacetum coccineum]
MDRFTSGSSSSHLSSDHSSSGHSILGHSLPGRSSPNPTIADSSTPLRFLSVGDSSSESSIKNCLESSSQERWSPAATVIIYQVRRALVPSHADLLPPRKSDRDVMNRVRVTMEVGMDVVGIDIPEWDMLMLDYLWSIWRGGGMRGSNARLRGTMMMERAKADRFRQYVSFIESKLRKIRRFCYYDRIRFRRLETFVARSLVEESLAAYEATRAVNACEAESQSQNRSNGDNRNGGNGNGGDRNGGDGNGNPNENNRDARLVARECTYQDFMKCQPLNFKGTEGVVRLIRWFEKMETVFHINNCPEKYQVKYATCTLLNSALTWWNSHKKTIGTDVAFAMSWKELMKLMAEVYCPRTETQKMESELWNLTIKNNDLATYTQRFQELTMMCTKMVSEGKDRVERFIGGLPDNIQGNVTAAEPIRLQDAVQIANNLMD